MLARFLPLAVLTFGLTACGSAPPATPPAPEVDVLTLAGQPVSSVVELPARVQAVRTAEVRARTDGIVERRLYAEGTDVRAGTPLFQIDPQQNQAAFSNAQAQLRRAEAGAANAAQVVQRYRPLVGQQAISDQEYEAAIAQSRQNAADVGAARAQAERARLDLGYTRVTAPISGRVGRAQVTEGALVSANQATLMTTVEQLDPVYVNFSQSNAQLLAVRREFMGGKIKAPNFSATPVTLILEDGSTYPITGHLDFLDLSVDEATGTISLRAEFPNPQRLLLPGQFVRARIAVGTLSDGLMVPQRAVQITPQGATVMIVGNGNIATARPVKLGDLQGGNWIVREGLRAGDRVIVNGLQKVKPGAPVRISSRRAAR